jgi:hypothetical protein
MLYLTWVGFLGTLPWEGAAALAAVRAGQLFAKFTNRTCIEVQ